MKTITILTATRAEYGLLKPIIKKLQKCNELKTKVAVTGAHLSPEFGLTYKEIENDGIAIDKKIEILLSADTPAAITKSMGIAMLGFADYFADSKPDALLVLGDRYETLAVCCAAMNERIPIIHLYGGETTEGAVDEAIRHAITKLSYLHFTSTEQYRKRVIQLGEDPQRVFCVGAIGTENAVKQSLLPKKELEKRLCFSLDKPYIVVTFHPVTLERKTAEMQCKAMLQALEYESKEMKVIFTKANADSEGRIINNIIEKYVSEHNNSVLFDSLGQTLYLSALKYAAFVLGNSSSGLSEAPSFHIPTINIGDRQKGRIRADTVIDCCEDTKSILEAIKKAKTPEFKEICRQAKNPYERENTADTIIELIKNQILNGKIDIKKKFYDIEL